MATERYTVLDENGLTSLARSLAVYISNNFSGKGELSAEIQNVKTYTDQEIQRALGNVGGLTGQNIGNAVVIPLPQSGWKGAELPYSQQISATELFGDPSIIFAVDKDRPDEEKGLFATCGIQAVSLENNVLTVHATKTLPAIDLEAVVVIIGGGSIG